VGAQDWSSTIANGATVLTVGVGGAWAYYKFVRGRTFHRRGEPSIDAELVQHADLRAIRATPSFVNTGGSNIPLSAKIMRVYAFTADDLDNKGRPNWEEVASAPVFTDHKHVESQETIRDDVFVKVPDFVFRAGTIALRASCFVYEERKKPGGICWTAHRIITLEKPEKREAVMDRRNEESIPGQREADEEEIRRAKEDSEKETRSREATQEEIEQAKRDAED
jgi:hypothetical protein